jgi:GDP-L-fucose synthase
MVDTPAETSAVRPDFTLPGKRIWVTGHRGMVGRAVSDRLDKAGSIVLEADRKSIDLRDQSAVRHYMQREKPDAIVIAAAKVGGILANATYPADFLYDNLMIEANLIEAAHTIGVEKLLFLGSSCIYPKLAPQPLTEGSLLTGPLEPTNEWYAIAKIAGIKLCQAYQQQHGSNFISAMPTNLYGPYDNFDLTSSHVIPAIMRKVEAARKANEPEVVIWGSGTPRREFMHVHDLADALVFLLQHYRGTSHVNVGVGSDVTIAELALLIGWVINFKGRFTQDTTKPDGTPRKLMDVTQLARMGWKASIPLEEGLRSTYEWYLKNIAENLKN